MKDVTKAAPKDLAHRAKLKRTVYDELVSPQFANLPKEMHRIGRKYTVPQLIEAAVAEWKRGPTKFNPAEFLRSLAATIEGT